MRKSVIDYMLFGKAIEVVEMVVEDAAKLGVGSDHYLWSSNLGRERSETMKAV